MSPSPGPFETFYHSALQHPWLLWVAALAALAFVLTRRELAPELRRYCVALVALSLADAWATSSHVYGVGPLSGAATRFVPLFFVLAGDFRYLLLVSCATRSGGLAPTGRRVAAAAGLTLIVPALAQGVLAALPAEQATSRLLFFVYESAFVTLVLLLLGFHARLREIPWLRRVSAFVVLYYALWAGADALLLATGSDLGFALRVVPNVLYYGGLIAVIAAAAPRRA